MDNPCNAGCTLFEWSDLLSFLLLFLIPSPFSGIDLILDPANWQGLSDIPTIFFLNISY